MIISTLTSCFTFIFISTIKITPIQNELTEWDVMQDYFMNIGNKLITRPPGLNNSYSAPVIVRIGIFLRAIDKVDEINMEMQAQLTFRMMWIDPRLKENQTDNLSWSSNLKYVVAHEPSKIWIPDLFFVNEKQTHKQFEELVPNLYLKIFPNGLVRFSKRLSLTLDCPMNLKYYPFDEQICPIRIGAYHSSTKELLLEWEQEPIQVMRFLNLPSFVFQNYSTIYATSRTSGGEFSVLQADLLFDRQFQFYFWKFFLPVITIVLISWVPFKLHILPVVRISIALSTVIFIGWHFLLQPNPLQVSYSTRLELWRGVNFVFVVLAALETILVMHMSKAHATKKYMNPDDTEKPDYLDVEVRKIKSNFKICFVSVPKEIQIIDKKCLIMFPIFYSVFIFSFWLMCYD